VRVSAQQNGETSVTFAVSDTGIGIAKEYHHAIFHDFAQIDSPIQKRLRGTGLGLSLSKRLAELLGGTVALQSELGTGSTFSVTLPLRLPQHEPGTQGEAMDEVNDALRPIDRSQHELLVVDDDPASRYATVRLLHSAGFRAREAATGNEALKAIDETISAMVLDVHLPDIDGFELCRIVHSRPATARLPILHLTAAYVTDDDKVRGLDSGADAYLTRPVEPAVLVATVQALVRTRVAEEAMRRSETKFRAIYSQAPGGICLLDRNGEFIDANPAMLRFLRRDAQAIVGHRVSEFVPKEWVQRVDAFTRQIDARGAPHEFPLVDPKGELIYLEWAVSPHIEPDINMAVVSDVSARILLEQQRQQLLDRERVARGAAERMSRMKDDLIAVLSHELRTPLNAIMSWTHVLKLRGGSDETIRGLSAIERNGNIQARMISDILDMSRFNLGKMRLTLETVDPAEAVKSAINAMRPSTDADGHDFVLDFEPPFRPIHVDTSRLQQILWNLLSNAIKFSPPGSEIRVSLREEPAACASRWPTRVAASTRNSCRSCSTASRRATPPATASTGASGSACRSSSSSSKPTAARSRRAAKGSGAAACSRSGCRSTAHPPTSASAARPRPSTGCPSSTAIATCRSRA
jgi:PAS domain S-box-containing protein